MAGQAGERTQRKGCGKPLGWTGAIPVYCGRMAVLCRRCKGIADPALSGGQEPAR